MTSDAHAGSWGRLQTLFREALTLASSDRAALVARVTDEDETLGGQLARMIAAHAAGPGVLDEPRVDDVREILAAGDADPVVGTRVGAYRVVRRLGTGGMGAVYEAEQDRPRRLVALKLIRPGLASPTLRRRFAREAELLGRLQHPGIAQIFDAGMHGTGPDTQPYFAMELVRGAPLNDWARGPGIDVAAKVALLARVGDALHHAHVRGVVHRDLKPENVLVDEGGRPKILDFGVARVLGADVQATAVHTEVGQLVGTLPYMSPEQVSGDPDAIDARSDVYALAVIAHELLAGELPYDLAHRSVPEAARIILEQEPTRLGAFGAALRGDLEAIVAKALEKTPARRYDSAAALAADLRRFLAHEPISARRPTTLYQLRKFSRRHKAIVGGIAAVILALVLGLAGTMWKAVAERRERQRAEREVAKTQAINDVLRAVLVSPDPFVGSGLDTTVGEAMAELTRRLDAGLVAEPEVEVAVRATLGNSYRHMGELDEAEPHLRKAWLLSRDVFGADDERTMEAGLVLGYLHENRGDVEAAAERFRHVVDTLAPGVNDSMRLAAMNSLGRALRKLGRPDESAPLLAAALDGARRLHGVEHPDTLYVMVLLAWTRGAQGRTDEALALVDEARAVRERVEGPDHPSTLIACEVRGMVLVAAGRLEEAEPWLRRAATGLARGLGREHQTTRRVRGELDDVLDALGRAAE